MNTLIMLLSLFIILVLGRGTSAIAIKNEITVVKSNALACIHAYNTSEAFDLASHSTAATFKRFVVDKIVDEECIQLEEGEEIVLLDDKDNSTRAASDIIPIIPRARYTSGATYYMLWGLVK